MRRTRSGVIKSERSTYIRNLQKLSCELLVSNQDNTNTNYLCLQPLK